MSKINRILVPLDGSSLAECVLSYAEEMGQKLGAEVVLVSITDRVRGYWPMEDAGETSGTKMVPESVCSIEDQAGQYLDGIKRKLEQKGIKVSREVICGKAAEEITIYANTQHIDLALMANHGRNGPSKLTHGKVVQEVLKKANVPVMVIRAPGC
jgi:nucleotide-binding universal stress UspA family protein